MKKLLFILSLFVCIVSIQAQNSTRKYNQYLERYEYFDSSGNMIGYSKWNPYLEQWEYTDEQAESKSRQKETEYIQPYNTDLLYEMARAQQEEYNRRVYANQQQKMEAERIKRNNTINFINAVIDTYNSAKNYPETIKDGWHNVYALNMSEFCVERKVYVKDNKIIKYVVNDLVFREIASSLPINKGKSTITLQADNSIINIFFIDYIFDPSSSATPITSGKLSFWTNDNKGGEMRIWLEGVYFGDLNSYFKKKATPICGQDGTCTLEVKAGTYNYTARNNSLRWSGTVTVAPNGCFTFGLTKK